MKNQEVGIRNRPGASAGTDFISHLVRAEWVALSKIMFTGVRSRLIFHDNDFSMLFHRAVVHLQVAHGLAARVGKGSLLDFGFGPEAGRGHRL